MQTPPPISTTARIDAGRARPDPPGARRVRAARAAAARPFRTAFPRLGNALRHGAAAGLLGALVPAAATAQLFVKVTDPANPIATDPPASVTSYAGASWVDYDGDGDDDLFVNRTNLYRNDGNGAFTRLTGLPAGQTTTYGNTWGDIDNDGDLDVMLSGGGGTGSSLFRNDGGDVFTKVTSGAIGQSGSNRAWGCAMGDYNHDGFVDIVLAAAFGFGGINNPNRLFLNNGDGSFTRIDTGVIVTGGAPYTIPTWSDHDLDGDLDLFIGAGPANGSTAPDYLYRNMREETGTAWFTRITTGEPATDSRDGQVFNWVDIDNDLDLDLYVTNYGGGGLNGLENDLYRNEGGLLIRTYGSLGPIGSDRARSLSSVWGDFDNDGDIDCLVTNDGGTARNRLYINQGGTFTSDSSGLISTGQGPHYGASAGDYDLDGDLDLYVAGPGNARGLFRNDQSTGNHWLQVRCGGSVSNRAAIGAKLRAKAVIGGAPVWQIREIAAQNSFNGQNSLVVHFGLGDATVVDSLIVDWPSGLADTLTGLAADRRILLGEAGEGAPDRVFPPAGAGGQLPGLTFRWRSSVCGGPYRLQVSLDSTFASGMIVDDSTLTDTTRAVGGLENGSTYYWRVNPVGLYPEDPVPDFGMFVVGSIVYSYALDPLWNLVSIPADMVEPTVAGLFPTAGGSAHEYGGGAYAERETLRIGRGYWVRVPSAYASTAIGSAAPAETIDVAGGWNLIGTAGDTVPVGSIASEPAGLIQSPVYGYRSGYHRAAALEPFRGYWVKSAGDGRIVLTLTPSAASKPGSASPGGASAGRLRIGDAGGRIAELFYSAGARERGESALYELPPPPPGPSPEASFAGRTILGDQRAQETIVFERMEFPLTVAWDAGGQRASLIIGSGTIALTGTGSAGIDASDLPVILVSPETGVAGAAVPEEFRLDQNHPNPFNPSTTLAFHLPSPGAVSVAVYSAAGREVFSREFRDLPAGSRSFDWDGREQGGGGAASGVYYLRAVFHPESGPPRSAVRAMLLLR